MVMGVRSVRARLQKGGWGGRAGSGDDGFREGAPLRVRPPKVAIQFPSAFLLPASLPTAAHDPCRSLLPRAAGSPSCRSACDDLLLGNEH